MKHCTTCGEDKPNSDFYHQDHKRCIDCQSIYYKEKRKREKPQYEKPIKDRFFELNGTEIF